MRVPLRKIQGVCRAGSKGLEAAGSLPAQSIGVPRMGLSNTSHPLINARCKHRAFFLGDRVVLLQFAEALADDFDAVPVLAAIRHVAARR